MKPAGNSDFVAKHTAVLSRLDYTQVKDGKIHFYPKDEFEIALPSFENNLILYGAKIRHPATGFKGRKLDEVLQETGGRIVGYSNQAMINNMGSPKLQTVLNITDPDLDNKIRMGEIAISPGFWYTAPDIGSLRRISGDHVLLYDRASNIPQGDVAAMIVNQASTSENDTNQETAYYGFAEGYLLDTDSGNTGENMTENPKELDSILQVLKLNQDELNGKILDKEKDILKLNQDIETKDATILKLNQDITAKDAKIGELEKQISDDAELKLKNQQDDFWGNLLEGTQEKFADRKPELLDPVRSIKLNQEILLFERNLKTPDLKNAEGDPLLKANQGDEVDEDIKTMREIKAVVGR